MTFLIKKTFTDIKNNLLENN